MRTLLTVACALVVACGGSTFVPASDGGTDSGSGGDSSTDSGGSTACPAQPPPAGTACAPLALTCEYGASSNRTCNIVATCEASGKWTLQTPAPGCGTKNPPTCPATYASVPQGTSCSASYPLDCTYPEGMCSCTPSAGGPAPEDAAAAARWFCDVPADAKCPKPRAKLGTACSTPNLLCDYGACTFPEGVAMKCESGYWKPVDVACPL